MVNEKIFLLSEIAIKSNLHITRNNSIKLSIIESKKKILIKKFFSELAYGSFFNIHINRLSKISNYVDEKFSNIIFLDLKKELIDLFISKKFKGIDRVVPIGNAFQMNLVWEGMM